ncbi:sensor histidine kinase [Algoriphagus limi]|uniref:Histidine kinase n=1 Tax=Algoriphagus limi TaxID=2975273 RepID=A0ABT2G667_9BACT|nr:sensor histidine kinase [Algoriphagus limi]MCS5490749.1 histidine kinase [Algoriphagus limi]
MQSEIDKTPTYEVLFKKIGPFILLNLGIALIISFSICPSCFLSFDGFIKLIPDFIFSFLVSCSLSFGGSVITDWLDRRISWIDKPIPRLFATIGIYLGYSFLVSYILVFFHAWFLGQFSLDNIPWLEITKYTIMPMQVAVVVMAIFTTWSWLGEWRKSAVEAERLKTEQFASQYQSLKDQLNPHFLFNSLNVLTNLVYEDADRSAAFIQKLSRIYRYVLEVQQEELVSLEKELDFAKNFLELQKIRFEDKLEFRVQVEDKKEYFLPPLSLQLLLENAIKHNVASKDNPLFIHIQQKNGELWVTNTLQLKNQSETYSTGVGLKNISKRYQLLKAPTPTAKQGVDEFLVILPLIQIES